MSSVNPVKSLSIKWVLIATTLFATVGASGCVSVPPQVAQTHEAERTIIQNLQQAHLGMVDAFIDQKKQRFDRFFFEKYAPKFADNWKDAFKEVEGREYDPDKDRSRLYEALASEYEVRSAPIEEVRTDLRSAISAEYRNALEAHDAVGNWLVALEDLNTAQRESINSLLGKIDPSLSIETIEQTVDDAVDSLESEVSG